MAPKLTHGIPLILILLCTALFVSCREASNPVEQTTVSETVLQPAPSTSTVYLTAIPAATAAVDPTLQPGLSQTTTRVIPTPSIQSTATAPAPTASALPTNPPATVTAAATPTFTATLTPIPPFVAEVFREPRFPVADIRDVVYGLGLRRDSWTAASGLQITLLLDVYFPNMPSEQPRPALMLFHGGGFTGGSADFPNMVTTAEFYASRGWVVFVVDYRLEEDYGSVPTDRPLELVEPFYPAGRDAKAAVRWLYSNAGQYNVSTNHITAMGGSAGAMLSLMLGVSDAADYRDEVNLEKDPTLPTTYLEAPAEVQTVVSFWGEGLLLDALAAYDGRTRYDAHDAPTLIVHGTEDKTIDIVHSEWVYHALVEAGVTAEFYALFDYGHAAWDAILEDGRTILELAFDFIVAQQRLVVGAG